METEGDPKTQKDREIQNDQIMSPPNEMEANEPGEVLTAAPQAQVPQEPSGHSPKSLEKVYVKNVEKDQEEILSTLLSSCRYSGNFTVRGHLGPGKSSGIW